MLEANEKNQELEHQLESYIRARLGSRVRHLRVVCARDGITIHGRTLTYHAKQLAQHVAMEIVALPVVANEIEVK